MLCENKVRLDRAKLEEIRYPVLCSVKHDGLRAITTKRGPVSRKMELIGNRHVREMMRELPIGLDGELVVTQAGVANFRSAQSLLRRFDGQPEFKFLVFDEQSERSAYSRYQRLTQTRFRWPTWAVLVPQYYFETAHKVWEFYQETLAAKHEGIVLKYAYGKYKHGRSTWREQLMLRLKEYETSEAKIIGVEEAMYNANDLEHDALGYAKRSKAAEGMFGKSTLGAFVCKDKKFKKTFKMGTFLGVTEPERRALWAHPPIGKIAHYRYDPSGGYDRPRQPVFLGFRDEVDL